MFFFPLLVVYLRDRGHDFDWALVKTTLWLYLGALGIYVAYHIVQTAWKLDVQRGNDLQKARSVAGELEAKINEIGRKPDLQSETLELSKELLDFVYDRAQNAPAELTPNFFNFEDPRGFMQKVREDSQMQEVFNSYQIETLEIYEYKFRRRVLATLKALGELGLSGESLKGIAENAKQVNELKIVGTTLAQLADQIPARSTQHKNA